MFTLEKVSLSIDIINSIYIFPVSVGASNPVLHMEDEVFLEKGTRGLVSCRTNIEVISAIWSVDPPPIRKPLVILDFYGGEWIKKVQKDFKGVIDIDQDFSLVIKDVRVESGATYHCTVGENGTRNVLTNHTTVNVFGKLHALKTSGCFSF